MDWNLFSCVCFLGYRLRFRCVRYWFWLVGVCWVVGGLVGSCWCNVLRGWWFVGSWLLGGWSFGRCCVFFLVFWVLGLILLLFWDWIWIFWIFLLLVFGCWLGLVFWVGSSWWCRWLVCVWCVCVDFWIGSGWYWDWLVVVLRNYRWGDCEFFFRLVNFWCFLVGVGWWWWLFWSGWLVFDVVYGKWFRWLDCWRYFVCFGVSWVLVWCWCVVFWFVVRWGYVVIGEVVVVIVILDCYSCSGFCVGCGNGWVVCL